MTNLFEYIPTPNLEEIKQRFTDDLEQEKELVEFHQQKVKELERKLAVIAMEMERRYG